MDENTNNKELLKNFTNSLRKLIENQLTITQKDVKALVNKYELSEEDLNKIEILSSKHLDSSKEKLEFGSWREAEDSALEALYLCPFSRENLIHILHIYIDKEKELGTKKPDEFKYFLNRLSSVDKHLYKKILKGDKKKSKINKKWVLLLLLPLLVIPLLFIFNRNDQSKDITPVKPVIKMSSLGRRDIGVTLRKTSTFKLNYKTIDSYIDGYTNDFSYTLKSFITSEDSNISYIRGKINWYNQFDEIIFTDDIETTNGPIYYMNEEIPLTYFKSSKRISPNFYRAEIVIKEVRSSKGSERITHNNIETLYKEKKSFDIEVNEVMNSITYGVISNYLSLTLEIKNIGDVDINSLELDLVWYDFYKVEKFKKEIVIIDENDIRIPPGGTRIVPLIFEIEEIENSFIVEVTKINE